VHRVPLPRRPGALFPYEPGEESRYPRRQLGDLDVNSLSPLALTNTVTGFATLIAGALLALMSSLTGTQPLRWRAAYAWIGVVGIATIGSHGIGEPTGGLAAAFWGFADVGSNLVLGWAIVFALLADLPPSAGTRAVRAGIALLNAVGLIHGVAERVFPAASAALAFASAGGLSFGELVIALDYLVLVVLLVRERKRMPIRARRLLGALGAMGLLSLPFAAQTNDALGQRMFAYHALWHLIGAFALCVLWVINEIRFEEELLVPRA